MTCRAAAPASHRALTGGRSHGRRWPRPQHRIDLGRTLMTWTPELDEPARRGAMAEAMALLIIAAP
jgi:hypothetical protein